MTDQASKPNRKISRDIIYHPHDALFSSTMSDLRVAKSFFREHLPSNILELTNLDSLQICKESFVDKELRKETTDILYSVNLSKKTSYFYLLAEHQSKPDKWMPFRLLKYMCRVMEHHIKDLKYKHLPVIVPLVFYTGSHPYNYSTDLFDLFDDPNDLARKVFLSPFTLVEVNKLKDEELKQQPYSGWMSLMYKHIATREFIFHFEEILKDIAQVFTDLDDKLLDSLLEYAVIGSDNDEIGEVQELVSRLLSPQHGEKVMTLGQRLYEQGIEKGMQQSKNLYQQGIEKGIQQGVQKKTIETATILLQEGTDLQFVERITGLPKSQLEKLAVSITEDI